MDFWLVFGFFAFCDFLILLNFICFFIFVSFLYLILLFLVEESELSGVLGKELFETDEIRKRDEQCDRVFLPPMLFGDYLTKNESIKSYAKLILLAAKVWRIVSEKKPRLLSSFASSLLRRTDRISQ